MGRVRTQRVRPLQCPTCGERDYLKMIGARHAAPATDNQAIYIGCPACGHSWWSTARAAVALYQKHLEAAGQQRLFNNPGT